MELPKHKKLKSNMFTAENLDLAGEVELVAKKIANAKLNHVPFEHICIESLFSESVCSMMVRNLPPTEYYSPLMHKDALVNGVSTRFELLLNQPGVEGLPEEYRNFWTWVSEMLRHSKIRTALADMFSVSRSMTCFPLLYRDVCGYKITPHTDIYTKAVTMQVYLPKSLECIDSGTEFYVKEGDKFVEVKRNPFRENFCYAFKVSSDSWHGVSEVSGQKIVRDSLMLIFYYSDYIDANGAYKFVDPNVMR